ncbi:hypothetical protein EBZ38_03440 [bacterium]|nr:hypothetical protein [bacterium]NDC94016.1 hypothetical protein [bacterium]NDD83321.1 hypothetical protein [bacterium]
MNSILAIIAVLLGILNIITGSKKAKAEKRLRDIEQEHHNEKLKLIEKEREAARNRLRDLLEHYRGPGNGKA